MGIHGLTGFIDKNQHLLHKHELHDCSVILDGNNFYHYLYYACHVQCSYGGDYDIYRKKIISTFESFKVCGITPYVVLDGAYTPDGRKLKTSLSRASARIRLIDVMANCHRGQALPSLAYETFLQTLSELGVPHATCQFEADNEIAVLSNKLQCPVLSNDSDFYIFDLSSGFLPLDYLDFRPLKKEDDGCHSYNFLHCYKYIVDDFINSFDGLNRSVLPVFASLLGNDFINESAFSTFYSKVKVPKVVSKKFSLPPRLSKVISVLYWLQNQQDSSEFSVIKDDLLNFIKPERKEKVEKLFLASVTGYSDINNFQGFDLFSYFTLPREKCRLAASKDFRSYSGRCFPQWFVTCVCVGDITPSILNCIILHRNIILTQVEDLSQPSSFVCSMPIRQVLYGILLKDDLAGANCTVKNGAEDSEVLLSERPFPDLDYDEDRPLRNERFCNEQKSSEAQSVDEVCDKISQSDTNSGPAACGNEEKVMTEEDYMPVDVEENEVDCLAEGAQYPENSDGKDQHSCYITEYTRTIKNLKKSLAEPVYCIENMSVPGLSEITSLPLIERKKLLCKICQEDLTFIENFSEDLQLFILCLSFWTRHSQPRLTLRHLQAVLTGLIFLKSLQSLQEREHGEEVNSPNNLYRTDRVAESSSESGKSSLRISSTSAQTTHITKQYEVDLKSVCSEASLSELKLLRQNLDKYKKSPVFNSNNMYEPRHSHIYAQLQAVMVDVINLDKLLRFPMPNCRPAHLLNGTFLYNFHIQLIIRPKPDLFIEMMLGRGSSLHQIFMNIVDLFLHHVQPCFISNPLAQTVTAAKKSKKRKSKAEKTGRTGAESELPDAEGDNSLEQRTVSGFDVTNRFSVLSLDGK